MMMMLMMMSIINLTKGRMAIAGSAAAASDVHLVVGNSAPSGAAATATPPEGVAGAAEGADELQRPHLFNAPAQDNLR